MREECNHKNIISRCFYACPTFPYISPWSVVYENEIPKNQYFLISSIKVNFQKIITTHFHIGHYLSTHDKKILALV